MAKIAWLNIPAHGHTNPTLPVVRELINNGHHVLYYSSEEYRAKIELTGADFRAYRGDMPTSKIISERMKAMIDASLMMIEMSESLTAWVIDEMRHEQPDLIIYDTTSMWGYIAARILGIPAICSITHFVLDGSQGQLPFRHILSHLVSAIPKLPRILKWRRTMAKQFGKDNVGGITEYADCNLVFTSREFHPENTRVDETFRFVGASIDESARETSEPVELKGDGKQVYISLGTINNLNTDFYQTAFTAFADYPANFILSVGRNTNISELPTIPDNFTAHHYVPQLQVLQQMDGFITHGGMNSVHEGLYYGVPQIVVPQQLEQALNGVRIQQVGAGILLGDKPPYGYVTAEELWSSLDAILNNPSYRQQAEHYGNTLRDAGGYRQAVAEIEHYLNQHIAIPEPA